jgi:hypothetical protein
MYKHDGDEEDNVERDISTKCNLSSTDESINSRKENCHDAQEKLGKKDPETPKQNPTIGQFQQFPVILFSTKSDFEKSKSKRVSRKEVFIQLVPNHIKKQQKK